MGSLMNALAIIAGGSVGLLLKGKIKPSLGEGLIKIIGLCVVVMGVSNAIAGDIMLIVASLALGTLMGELLAIDDSLNRFGRLVQSKLQGDNKDSTFAEGFVGSTILFCVGAMSIVGSINSGLLGDLSVITTKSILDGATSMILASSLGVGVLLSAIVVFLYQGSIELFAGHLQDVFTPLLISQISAVGGVMLLGIGMNMVLGTKIKVANTLPGFIFAVGYYLAILAG
ncbi:MAG: DUF554 domain-containing protein [Turicibacter sp.]|nr:DUF554 domain-containing protein [Turicibacter sp.]